ncbi:hypothetical protein Emag_000741 [Eimeria magna]
MGDNGADRRSTSSSSSRKTKRSVSSSISSIVVHAFIGAAGRYIPSYTFKENVDLSDPILSRFDLISVLRDIPDADEDFSVADYVLGNHQLHHPNILSLHAEPQKRIAELESRLHAAEAHEPINQQLLQKYILYARAHCHPILDPSLPSLSAKLSSFYAKLRKRAAASGGLPLTLRHVESLLRISEANAKMRLSPTVSLMDVEFAIAAVLSSFLSAQKFAVQQRLSKEFARYTALATGGWATLAALLRRLLQQRLQRATLRQREAEGDEETTTLKTIARCSSATTGFETVRVKPLLLDLAAAADARAAAAAAAAAHAAQCMYTGNKLPTLFCVGCCSSSSSKSCCCRGSSKEKPPLLLQQRQQQQLLLLLLQLPLCWSAPDTHICCPLCPNQESKKDLMMHISFLQVSSSPSAVAAAAAAVAAAAAAA